MRMPRLAAKLDEQLAESVRPEKAIRKNREKLGHGG
jgi:hypothetical protein